MHFARARQRSGSCGIPTPARGRTGTATYVKDAEIPADRLRPSKALHLDLEQVKNLAQVKLNGRDLGILWKPTFHAEITGAARAGTDRLEIHVTNLWPNRLIGDEQLPRDRPWNGKLWSQRPPLLLEGEPSPTARHAFHLEALDQRLAPAGVRADGSGDAAVGGEDYGSTAMSSGNTRG